MALQIPANTALQLFNRCSVTVFPVFPTPHGEEFPVGPPKNVGLHRWLIAVIVHIGRNGQPHDARVPAFVSKLHFDRPPRRV